MDSHKSSSRISKIRILPSKLQKKQFSVPLSNRYFSRISIQKPVMGLSLNLSSRNTDSSEKNTQCIGRSLSMHVNRKESLTRNRIQNLDLSHNLPQIKTKNPKRIKAFIEPSEIISSEVGVLSFNMIMDLKQKIEEGLEVAIKQSTFKANSIATEDYSIQEGQDQNKPQIKTSDERPYQEYDKILMMKEPVIYKRKRFNLKHKASWVIPI